MRFTKYERTRREEIAVAVVTRENIGELAALVKGQVDYRGSKRAGQESDEPVLVVASPSTGGEWRIKLGWTVSHDGETLVNQNGFNNRPDIDGWTRVKCDNCGHDQHGRLGMDGEICGFEWGLTVCACGGEDARV